MPEMTGHAPTLLVSELRPSERDLYRMLWEKAEYRRVSPGEAAATGFLQQAHPKQGAAVLDLGCGTGRGGLILALVGGLNVTLLDFVPTCLDADIRAMLETQSHALRFIEADLTQELPIAAEYGFCVDVMEHIQPAQVDRVLNHILRSCQHVFFQIATEPDVCGALVGHPLHLSLHPYAWWLQQFNDRECVVHWSHDAGGSCLFYLSAWIDGPTAVAHGDLNVTPELIRAHVTHNIAQGWKQVEPHETNGVEVMILGGGPTLSQFEDEIRQKHDEGVKIVTLNGTYNWCLERGIGPVTQIMVDARPFNARFTKPVDPRCLYLIASQCDPAVLEGLPKERTYLWHTATEMIQDLLKAQYETWWQVPGGSTVLTRAILMLRMLGFARFHLYGCDSCLAERPSADYQSEVQQFRKGTLAGEPVYEMDYAHHAYAQPENDSPFVLNVICQPGGRLFKCNPWMFAQAQEFMDLIKYMGNELEIEVYGDGLLNHILLTGARLSEEGM